MPRLKIMTLNLWGYHGNWETRRDRLIATMQSEELDVVLLQEVAERGWRINQAVELASMTGYALMYVPSQLFFPWPTVATGLAILSRFPMTSPVATELVAASGVLPVGAYERRIAQRVELALDSMSVILYNTHFPLRAEDRMLAARRLAALVAQEEAVLVVVGGDFNARPTEASLQLLQGTLPGETMHGSLTDAWTTAGIGAPETYSTENPRARIDYILYQSEPSIIVQETRVIGHHPQEMSDHAGVVATFSISPTREMEAPVNAEPVATLEPV
jgi:endonuclease/exonuclease/phosphatase family metal-dependent hydrolase